MRASARPRLRAAGDVKGGTRRVRSGIVLLVIVLVLTGWVAAFARLRRSALPGRDDLGIRGRHRKDDDLRAARRQRDDALTPPLIPPRASASSSAPSVEPHGAVTFVLVSTMSPDSAPRVANLLASMRAFLEPGSRDDARVEERVVAELLVLVPDAELDWWKLAASALGADAPWGATRVVPESRALPTPVQELAALASETARREARGLGYRTQMLLKLAAGFFVRTPFYVTLDCDVVLRGALRVDDLLDGSRRRALAQGAMGGPHAARWLSHSLDALFGEKPGAAAEASGALGSDDARARVGRDDDAERGDVSNSDAARRRRALASMVGSCGPSATSRGVGVTPAILSAALAKRALAHLDDADFVEKTDSGFSLKEKKETRWDARLFRSLDSGLDWTEYGLYAAFACVEGTFDEVHFVDAGLELYDAALQQDGSKFADADAMRAAFGTHPSGRDGGGDGNGKRALFVVVQSIGGSDPVAAARAVKPFLVGDSR